MTPVGTWKSGAVAGVAALLHLALMYTVLTRGFPDGHLTAYERASHLPRLVLGGLGMASSLVLWFRPGAWGLVWVVVCWVVQFLAVPFWFLTVLGLEDGQGG